MEYEGKKKAQLTYFPATFLLKLKEIAKEKSKKTRSKVSVSSLVVDAVRDTWVEPIERPQEVYVCSAIENIDDVPMLSVIHCSYNLLLVQNTLSVWLEENRDNEMYFLGADGLPKLQIDKVKMLHRSLI